MRLHYFIIIFILFLSGCAGRNQSQKLIANITSAVKKEYNVDTGATIAKYDLTGLSSGQCLYFKDYANVINNASANARLINKILPKIAKKHMLEARAQSKIVMLKTSLMKLQDKYSIFTSSEIRKLEPDDGEFDAFANLETNHNALKELSYIDHLAERVPIFFPQGASSITSLFGMRKHPISKEYKFHSGVDFASHKAAPIYAAASGHVLSANNQNGYGKTLVINHGHHFKTKYAHLCKMFVKKGEHVVRGQKIALQGCTGNSTAEHLHFEVILKDRAINPLDFVERGYKCQK